MKTLLVILLLLAAVVWGYQNPDKVEEYYKAGTDQIRTLFFPEEAKVAAVFSYDPPPEGIYYTREIIYATTASGQRVIGTGSQVRKVGEGHERVMVDYKGERIIVELAKLTREPREINELKRRGMAEVAEATSKQVRSLDNQLEALERKIEQHQAELASAEKREQTEKAKGRVVSSMVTSSAFIRNQLVSLETQRATLRQKRGAVMVRE